MKTTITCAVVSTICVVVASATVLSGCGTGLFAKPEPVVSVVPAACKGKDAKGSELVNQVCVQAFNLINEADAILLSADRTIVSRFQSEIWTKAEAQGYLVKTGEFGDKVSMARQIFRSGNFAEALSQATLTKRLVVELEKQIAAAARAGGT